ncbi:MBL fold metallo-hydrolase [Paenibacillus oenotherae]|uniref:MBL fold metallo-hydrolase n=1 Tax=Paenibacillus oenotherae TaxID=1435645 RepID=A0ABS7D5R1_9BACL|nr:MBL fold metallo-hydrolase [Paenibacillus oenotherae]MBW7475279.1 MBL fold metallo-hydrolase [Paenibacillus oenotherae]
MKITQIRNATLVVEYAGKKFLIDPFLADKGTYPPFPNSVRQDQFNPLVSLPTSLDNIINVDAVIATHLHIDHFDDTAKEMLPKDIQLIKTKGEHGRGEILKLAGDVCGVVFKHEDEKTLYIAGDTVWYKAVQEVIEAHKPEIIVVNGGDNQFLQGGSLVMGKEDIYHVCQAAPNSQIISVHMEAVNHWTLSRDELRSFLAEKGSSSNVLIPDDGESYTF